MTLDERIQAISIERPNEGATATAPPKADTLVTLLTQGLQSEDKKILNVSSWALFEPTCAGCTVGSYVLLSVCSLSVCL